MIWKQRYRLTSYLRSSLWIIPIGAAIIEQVSAGIIHTLDARLGWAGIGLGLDGAKALANAVLTFSLSFIVFTFGSLLVAIQVASGQYTPRIIATTLLRDNVIRFTVGLFVFTLLFAIKTLNRIETTVPQLVVFVTGLLGILCLVAFLFLIDYAARMLRPVSLVKRVGDAGLRVIESVYPEMLTDTPDTALPTPQDASPVGRTILQRGTSGIILAVNIPPLIVEAKKANGVIELAPQVGDFVGAGEPLFLLHDGAAAIEDHALRGCVIFGSERTMEQDPLFALRILVDIAIKALSAAINDPTTAVLAIDQLHRVVRSAGRRNLRADSVFDSAGKLRVIFRTPDWEDFVHLAFTEIRSYGASNIQIARRLRAMLFNLANTLPAERQAALRLEYDLLDRMLEKLYVLPEDRALARIPDSQGLGNGGITTGYPF
ncbi:MAG TPA: DUF2254 domain-containing protein [Chthoniobacterales bacterium]